MSLTFSLSQVSFFYMSIFSLLINNNRILKDVVSQWPTIAKLKVAARAEKLLIISLSSNFGYKIDRQ